MEYAISIDIGGTYIKYALIGIDGVIQFEGKCTTEPERGRNHVIGKITHAIAQVQNWAEDSGLTISGIGIGTPGIIDNGLILGGAENLPEWESLPLAGILGKYFDMPIFIDNDANLMGLGEVRFGVKGNTSDVVFLTVGTGIGGALVLDGKLYGGHRNRGAELGHFIVDPNGASCSCGARGCLEAQASVKALVRDYMQLITSNGKKVNTEPDGKYIVEKYHEKEPEAIQAMNIHFNYLSAGIAGFINFFSPQKVVIGGGITEAGSFYIDELRARALKIAMKETQIFTEICPAELGNWAGCYGAAALVFDHLGWFEKKSSPK